MYTGFVITWRYFAEYSKYQLLQLVIAFSHTICLQEEGTIPSARTDSICFAYELPCLVDRSRCQGSLSREFFYLLATGALSFTITYLSFDVVCK